MVTPVTPILTRMVVVPTRFSIYPLFSHFRLARRNVPLRLAPHLSDDGGGLQAEVNAADGGYGRPGHRPRLPLHLVRQPISPAVLQLWDNDR